jgi:hypothetical protein
MFNEKAAASGPITKTRFNPKVAPQLVPSPALLDP